MSYLLDPNVLLRYIIPEHPLHLKVVNATDKLKSDRQKLCITSQNLIELWNVATRPVDKNGFGFSSAKTEQEIRQLKTLFTLLPDTKEVYPLWEKLVADYQVKGVNVHDTRLVAFMLTHGISHILTFNTKDFQRFSSEITVVHPDTVLA